MEIEKDIREREKLLEQLQVVDKRLNIRNGLLIGMLKGILENQKAPGASQSVQVNLLISGGTDVKFQGVTIHKHTTCDTWYARYRFGGKQHYVSAKTQQLCYDKLKHALSKTRLKQLQKSITYENKQKQPPAITLLEWFKKWQTLYKQNVKRTTIKEYLNCMKYLESIQDTPLNKITSIQLLELINAVPFERTKQKVYELANAIFSKALDNELIAKNPMTVIDKPKHRKTSGSALSNEDEKKLEEYLKLNNLDIFLVCLYQGLRRGEAMALTIDDIDFEKKYIKINKSINNYNEVDSTKNVYSERFVPIFDKTLTVLEKYKNTTGRIFNLAHQTYERMFKKCVNQFETRYTIHSLRHTFITRCQEAKIPLHIIQKWVGHVQGSAVTTGVYTHTRIDAEAENIKLLNEKLNSN